MIHTLRALIEGGLLIEGGWEEKSVFNRRGDGNFYKILRTFYPWFFIKKIMIEINEKQKTNKQHFHYNICTKSYKIHLLFGRGGLI